MTHDVAGPSVASGGSQRDQPVGWLVENHVGQKWLCDEMPKSPEVGGWKYTPLYRTPQPALTPDERKAIEYLMVGGTEGPGDVERAMLDIARKLLERTS